jgi:HPt (histidine-containing phosphotransfer) domain-containing protein
MSETLIDKEAWERMKSMTGPAFLVELIDVFLKDSPDLIKEMRAGLTADDSERVRRAAHSLKSNSASFGADRLAGVARELEMVAKSGELNGAEPKLFAVEAEYAQLLPLLEELKHER